MTDRLYLAFLIGITQVICGILALLIPEASHVTAAYLLFAISHYVQLPTEIVVASAYSAAGWMAIAAWAMSELKRTYRILLLVPQYLLLALQLVSINIVVWQGKYPDGYVPDGGSAFIFWDQAWAWLFAAYPIIDAIVVCMSRRTPRV